MADHPGDNTDGTTGADAGPTGSSGPIRDGHHGLIGQPHDASEGPALLAAEAEAAAASTPEHPLGGQGPKLSRRSPFLIGLGGAAGAAVSIGVVELVLAARQELLLVLVALFFAVGMEPAVSWLARHGLPRWSAVTLVLAVAAAMIAGFFAAVIPPLVAQGSGLWRHAPDDLTRFEHRYPLVRTLEERVHLQDHLHQGINPHLLGGLVGIGKVVFGGITAALIVLVLAAYLLADFRRVRAGCYRLVPRARRARAILLGDEILAKVGAYILGNLVISLITGLVTFIWLVAFGVPYPLLLAVVVAVLDLIPLIGSTVAGVIAALVALTVSLPVSIATVVFFVVLRLVEDYALVPRIIGRAVRVPALVTVVATLLGGSVLGIVGALLAIPVAAAVLLLLRETVFPALDR